MPTLHWIGKEKVLNHHLDVPYRTLRHTYAHGQPDSGNRILHGDNLEALKALLPEYEGRVKCIYIDPPYNTGNEGWAYNDAVNDPKILRWLHRTVGKEGEDLSRHDKWLCMMYPRLRLLHKLLADDGAIFISIDDNEQAHLRLVMDEIWGAGNFVAPLVWRSRKSVDARNKTGISNDHEYILVYGKSNLEQFRGVEKDLDKFSNPDNDSRGAWRSADLTGLATKDQRPNLHYDLTDPETGVIYPCPEKGWRFDPKTMKKKIEEKRILFPKSGEGRPRNKLFMQEMASQFKAVSSVILDMNTGDGTRELNALFEKEIFSFPKPPSLVEFLIDQICSENDIILDSFAGSGTTAHAVLNLNRADGGSRKFILIEMEDYAETLTAERVRRVMAGYAGKEGTGGGFDFYELGEAIFREDGLLNEAVGEAAIRRYVWHAETRAAWQEPPTGAHRWFLGLHDRTAWWFCYDREQAVVLDIDLLSSILAAKTGETSVVYADYCTVPDEVMQARGIRFKKIPRDIPRL